MLTVFLSDLGFNAFGFDPVIRKKSPNLFNSLWSIERQEELISDVSRLSPLYILRCVLPHILILFISEFYF